MLAHPAASILISLVRYRYLRPVSVSMLPAARSPRHPVTGSSPRPRAHPRPAGWTVGDKTGTGRYGADNGIAILWPPKQAPIVLAVMSTKTTQDATPSDALIAASYQDRSARAAARPVSCCSVARS